MKPGAGVASLCAMTETIEQRAVDTVVSVQDLRVRYGATVAVDGISLNIRRGEIFGILGPNGAGKTTTVECIGGLRTPDEGTISVLGLDARDDRDELRQRVGIQLQSSGLPDKLRVGEALELFAAFYSDPAESGRAADAARTQRQTRRALREPLRRAEATPLDCAGADRLTAAGDPRRAHHRLGSRRPA
jgi:ABC-type Fe3+/spermidine/putrescine transport system ATPase subunit